MTDFKPTAEQVAVLDAFEDGGNMVIEAGAGTGKTSTLKQIADSTDTKMVYLAYNKSIATEAKRKFPRNVQCATAHSFAFRAVGIDFKDRIDQKTWPDQAARILGIPDRPLKVGVIGGEEMFLGPRRQASLVYEMVQRFCYSVDTEVGPHHMPRVPGVEDPVMRREVSHYLTKFAQRAWADLTNENGKLGWNRMHDIYLKLWALTKPKLPGKVVLFDEAQDANPCTAGIVLGQEDAQLIAVGDRCQAIYGWRGATDAMQTWPAQHRMMLSQSFRFGPAVAAEANKWLTLLDAPLRLSGYEKIDSKIALLEEPDTVLCRTNASVIAEALQAQQRGLRVAIMGGTREIETFAKAVMQLQRGESTEHPDLAAFKNWNQVVEYVEQGEANDLKVLVNLIQSYGVDVLFRVASTATDERQPHDILLSTAHKSKGNEWNKVRIAGDFQMPEPDIETGEMKIQPAEAMLAYVAVTRAQKVLDRSGVAWVDLLLKQMKPSSATETIQLKKRNPFTVKARGLLTGNIINELKETNV